MIKKNELPDGFGLLSYNDRSLRMVVRAPLLKSEVPVEDRVLDAMTEIARKNTQLLWQQAGGWTIGGNLCLPREDT